MATPFMIVGMVHLGNLNPSSHGVDIDAVEEAAIADALALKKAGFDGVMIENFGDAPFFPDRVPAHTIASMSRIAHSVSLALNQDFVAPTLGINVLRNDAQGALAVAASVGADFVRVNVLIGAMVTDQGIIEGKAHEVIRTRNQLAPKCEVWADLRVKHAAPLAERPLSEEAHDLWTRSGASAIIVSGSRTGAPLDPAEIDTIRSAVPDARIIAGSGVTPDQIPNLVPRLDGIIVGTWIKAEGKSSNPVDPERASRFVEAVHANLE